MDIPGRVAMANAGPGTGSSQFFITETPQDRLTGLHTIFGQVVEGMELVGRIARLPRGPGDKPNVPVKMSRVVITRYADPNAPKPLAPATKKATPRAKPAAPAVKKATPAVPPAPK
jgi:peptidyl-prolyl cis-trans isomerase A (cyclophilin A)